MSLLYKCLPFFVCVLFKFVLSQNKICVYMKDCPDVFELLKLPTGQLEIEKMLCKNDRRYPKVWCKIPCGSANSTGFCSLEHDCPHRFAATETCKVKSNNRFVCCPRKSSPIVESTTEAITTETTTKTSPVTTTKPKTGPTIANRHTEDFECGIQSDQNKIVNGKIADFTDHPWMALLQYKEKGKLVTNCGGVLINQKFVLTAAHCVDTPLELVNVILGEYNLSSPVDCFRNYCIPKPEIIGIKRTILHPAWVSAERKFFDDIALIELTRDVKYTDFIRPICLSSQTLSDISREKLTVSGWGRTEEKKSSDVKRIAIIEMQQRVLCLNTIRIPLRESQLCVGGTDKDSCNGDSGGPLMAIDYSKTLPTWRLEGLVSFGRGKCGSLGRPGIYTNVPYYMDWIKENIK